MFRVCISADRLTGDRPSLRTRERGGAKIVVLALVCLVAGFGGGLLWHRRAAKPPIADAGGASTLSEGTKAVLRQLASPVEIRFYATLGGQEVPERIRAFVKRTDDLLAAFETAAAGKITLTRHESASDADIRAAVEDGIQTSSLESGGSAHLGIVLVQGAQREALSPLSPDWEGALQADLARAINRVAAAHRLAAQTEVITAADAAAAESVQRALPNFNSLSQAEAEQQLRETALQDFKAAAKAFQTQIEQAQERLSQAMKAGSETEQQAALAQLRQLQSEQTARLKEISLRLRTHVTALEKLKSAGPSPAPAQTNPPPATR